jgi:hypothetical protein
LLRRKPKEHPATMDWTALAPAVFSLLGVALGTTGSLLGVYYAQRTAREQLRLQHDAALRTERKEVILGYLHAVENSWSFLDGLWGRQPLTSATGEPLAGEAVDREAAVRNHEVWYHQMKLDLVGSEPMRRTSVALTQALYQATFHRDRVTETLWGYLGPIQEDFMAAARDELRADDASSP